MRSSCRLYGLQGRSQVLCSIGGPLLEWSELKRVSVLPRMCVSASIPWLFLTGRRMEKFAQEYWYDDRG